MNRSPFRASVAVATVALLFHAVVSAAPGEKSRPVRSSATTNVNRNVNVNQNVNVNRNVNVARDVDEIGRASCRERVYVLV